MCSMKNHINCHGDDGKIELSQGSLGKTGRKTGAKLTKRTGKQTQSDNAVSRTLTLKRPRSGDWGILTSSSRIDLNTFESTAPIHLDVMLEAIYGVTMPHQKTGEQKHRQSLGHDRDLCHTLSCHRQLHFQYLPKARQTCVRPVRFSKLLVVQTGAACLPLSHLHLRPPSNRRLDANSSCGATTGFLLGDLF